MFDFSSSFVFLLPPLPLTPISTRLSLRVAFSFRTRFQYCLAWETTQRLVLFVFSLYEHFPSPIFPSICLFWPFCPQFCFLFAPQVAHLTSPSKAGSTPLHRLVAFFFGLSPVQFTTNHHAIGHWPTTVRRSLIVDAVWPPPTPDPRGPPDDQEPS